MAANQKLSIPLFVWDDGKYVIFPYGHLLTTFEDGKIGFCYSKLFDSSPYKEYRIMWSKYRMHFVDEDVADLNSRVVLTRS